MNDTKFEDIKAKRGEGMSWKQIAEKYGTNARALGKAFSVARLARGGAPLRTDKPRTVNLNPNGQIKKMLQDAIDDSVRQELDAVEYRQRLEDALSILETA